jgi:hypothetical protein
MTCPPSRGTLGLVTAALLLGFPLAAAAQSTYLWEALDSISYDYGVSVLADTDGTYRAYWCATEGITPEKSESEGAFVQQSSVPWNFFPPGQQYALRTTGARIVRLRHAGTNERWDRLMQFDAGHPAGYVNDRTLGYLRRERHDASGANIELWQCTIGSDHFITAFKDYECGGLPAVKLGYAYSVGGPGLSPRYRCINPVTGEHMTASDPGCEGTGYVVEGPVGNWRDGTTYTHPHASPTTWEVSPFRDGAFLCPNSVIKDADNVYYMTYTASPHFGSAGPFNEQFLATSTDGVTFSPVVDASGLPRPLATYLPTYLSDVVAADVALAAAGGDPIGNLRNAWGVGAGHLMKVGNQYRLYYVDSSRYISTGAPGCPNHGAADVPKGGTQLRLVLRTASSIEAMLAAAGEPGHCVTAIDASGAQAADQQAIAAAEIVHDTQNGLYWQYRGDANRTTVWWGRSGDTSGTTFFVSGPNQGLIADGPGVTHRTPSGLYHDRYGSVSSCCGWYVYLGHSHRQCTPFNDNTCGNDHLAVTLFRP